MHELPAASLPVDTFAPALAATKCEARGAFLKYIGRSAAVGLITFSGLTPLVFLSVFITDFACSATGASLQIFRDTNFGADQAFLLLFSYSALLRAFFIPAPGRAETITRWAFLLVALAIVGVAPTAAATSLAVEGYAFWLVANCLGKVMRAAMPVTFRFDRALFAMLAGSIVNLALIVTFMTNQPSGPYVATAMKIDDIFIALYFLTLSVTMAIPAFLVAKCARTSDPLPLMALTTLLCSPIAVGAMAMPITAGFSAQLAPFYLQLVAITLPISLSTYTIVALGAWAGAKSNAYAHRLKAQKADGLELNCSRP